ncbi:hypothetical protein K4T86_11915 [Staphylococcus epidermidis]|jgi:uncharacterized lipoprotein NlpE involved in copper resistance|nr:hypothetical protein [Staphylococcus epidermidis]MCG2268448.1 hypothetical protein [Staphylococcus epidermidis]
MKKFFVAMIVFCFILVGCSNSSNKSNEKTVKMGEMLNSGEKVSFVVNSEEGIDKDSTVWYYVYTKDGKVTVYNSDLGVKLGEVSKLSDKDLIERMKKEDKDYFENSKSEASKTWKDFIETAEGDQRVIRGANKSLDALDKLSYKKPKTMDLKVKVITDGSGNNTEKEKLNVSINNIFKEDGDRASLDSLAKGFEYKYTNNTSSDNDVEDYFNTYDTVNSPIEVYDSKFVSLNSDEDDSALVTKVGEKTTAIEFDDKNDENVSETEE